MAIDLDSEIIQDFLLEYGEILELLGEQLVELEQSPDAPDLLNAIFRGFHTVKGGAGFLAINALVDICHSAEDVFNVLRQGERQVSPDLMDIILQVVDVVTEMFDQLRSGNEPEPAEKSLLTKLRGFTSAKESVVEEIVAAPTKIGEPSAVADVVGQTFDGMLESTDDHASSTEAPGNDEITERELDDLFDALHGKGGSPTPQSKAESTQHASASDEMTEDEFDDLLDQLHAKSKFSRPNANTSGSKEDASEPEPTMEKAVEQAVTKPEPPAPDKVAQSVKTAEPEAKKPAKPAQTLGETTVRVDTQVLDEIMNMVGELVLVRNRFQTLKANVEAGKAFSKAVSNLDVVTADLQRLVMKTRMQPIKKVFGRFPRVVRDLAKSLKKEIKLELVGEETDLDKNLVEALADPLVHLVRNAVDHGIELPEERIKAGKEREGVVILTASQEGDHIRLSIKDDGKGMNADVLRAIIVEKGLMDEENAARLDDKACYNLICMPGFSTKSEISDVSGRGVGMDVVKTRISQMNGRVEIDSVEGIGSTIIIKVPLTLAIMPTFMVKLGGQAFALPLASVLEILDLDLHKTNVVDEQLVVLVRGRALPLFYLSEWLVQDPSYIVKNQTTGYVVVVNADGRQIGFVVDQLIGQEEVVIKPLGAKLQGLDGLAGATITGDGKIALILDVPGLVSRYAA